MTCSWVVHDLPIICSWLFIRIIATLRNHLNYFTNYLLYWPPSLPFTTSLKLLYFSYLTWTTLLKVFESKYFIWTTLLMLLPLNYFLLFTSLEVPWFSHFQSSEFTKNKKTIGYSKPQLVFNIIFSIPFSIISVAPFLIGGVLGSKNLLNKSC